MKNKESPLTQPIIWVLDDGRPGNYSQALGLAESLSSMFSSSIEIKKIHYNFLAKLPNFLKLNGLFCIRRISVLSLLNQKQSPQIIISAGRKASPIAAFLKEYYQPFGKVFLVQIMNPNFDFNKFDMVILPSHDKENYARNIVRIIGALGRLKTDLLELEYQKFAEKFDKISSPKIALLVGGSSKNGKFEPETAKNLGQIISKITNKMKANLLVLNSRRTGGKITEILDQNLNCPKHFFRWESKNWKNPYFAVLKTSDYVIATGDSISMCSEICSLGKPVYIFNPEEICSTKHLKFHQDLFTKGFAIKLDENIDELQNYSVKKLDETNRIAARIVNILGEKIL